MYMSTDVKPIKRHFKQQFVLNKFKQIEAVVWRCFAKKLFKKIV